MSFPKGIFAARARARGSDFCEFLTFRENFSQKKFLKKFSKIPENRLTFSPKCGIIDTVESRARATALKNFLKKIKKTFKKRLTKATKCDII
jgi:hypothetical protein